MKKSKEEPGFKVWQCKIVVPKDARLPFEFDYPPSRAAIKAVESAGIPVLNCFSGWGGCLTPGEDSIVRRDYSVTPEAPDSFDFKGPIGTVGLSGFSGSAVPTASTASTEQFMDSDKGPMPTASTASTEQFMDSDKGPMPNGWVYECSTVGKWNDDCVLNPSFANAGQCVLASTPHVPDIVNVFDFKYAHGNTIAEKTLGLLVHIAETTGTLMRKQNLSTASKEEVVVHAPPALVLVIVQHCAKQYGIDMPWTVNLDGTMPHDRIAITLKDMCANIHIIDFSA